MNRPMLTAAFCAAAWASCAHAAPASGDLTDVPDGPAIQSPIAAKKLLLSVAQVGDRLVAVGPRGHVVVSLDDVDAGIARSRARLAALVLAVIAATSLTLWWLNRTLVLKPVAALIRETRRVAEGDLTTKKRAKRILKWLTCIKIFSPFMCDHRR